MQVPDTEIKFEALILLKELLTLLGVNAQGDASGYLNSQPGDRGDITIFIEGIYFSVFYEAEADAPEDLLITGLVTSHGGNQYSEDEAMEIECGVQDAQTLLDTLGINYITS